MTQVSGTPQLTPAQREQVARIRTAAISHDQVDPLNESADLAVRGQRPGWHLLTQHGYAQLDLRDASLQMVVDPQYRCRGEGRELLAAALDRVAPVHCWAFGTLPAAEAMAITVGAHRERVLLQMCREFGSRPEPASPPPGIRLRSYRDTDLAALAEANAAAFAHHPEQGALSVADLTTRMAQPWWDPNGLIVAVDDSDRLIGFHWTKLDTSQVPPTGEVYVLGVRPEAAGAGLGRTLLQAGLRFLYDAGVRAVQLFVEGDQDRAIGLYESASFSVVRRDSSYRCDPIAARAGQE